MRIKVLEETGIKDAPYFLSHNDEVTVPDEYGARWCGAGWAQDLDGVVATGERDLRPKTVDPIVVTNKQKG